MRTLKRHILVMGFILCTCVNVYAANSGSQSLFPKSLGMTGEIVGKMLIYVIIQMYMQMLLRR